MCHRSQGWGHARHGPIQVQVSSLAFTLPAAWQPMCACRFDRPAGALFSKDPVNAAYIDNLAAANGFV
jgi:hypothetical protein